MPTLGRSASPQGGAIAYTNIIFALVLHDIKNRFFGSGLGQIVMVLWPFVHIVLLITIYYVTNRPNPYGEGIIQYGAVSVFPFIIFNYVARWIVFSAITNKQFLNYPIIRPLDIILGRTVLEIVSITMVGILLVLTVTAAGYDAMPSDKLNAISAVLATLFLAISFGVLNAPFAFIIPMWNIVIMLVIILSYVSSGIVFQPTALPANLQYYLSFNPLLNCTEWLRAGYYSDYPTAMIDKTYVVSFSLTCLTLGLLLNKLLRRFY